MTPTILKISSFQMDDDLYCWRLEGYITGSHAKESLVIGIFYCLRFNKEISHEESVSQRNDLCHFKDLKAKVISSH